MILQLPYPEKELWPVQEALAEARRVYTYDPETGDFSRRIRRGQRGLISLRPGTVNRGYRRIRLLGKWVSAHRLAWLLHFGEWPADMLDHINGDRLDNRIKNLRIVDNSTNLENLRRARSDNRLGVQGVRKRGSAFEARIWVKGHAIQIGTFATAESAHDAYIQAKRALHEGCTL